LCLAGASRHPGCVRTLFIDHVVAVVTALELRDFQNTRGAILSSTCQLAFQRQGQAVLAQGRARQGYGPPQLLRIRRNGEFVAHGSRLFRVGFSKFGVGIDVNVVWDTREESQQLLYSAKLRDICKSGGRSCLLGQVAIQQNYMYLQLDGDVLKLALRLAAGGGGSAQMGLHKESTVLAQTQMGDVEAFVIQNGLMFLASFSSQVVSVVSTVTFDVLSQSKLAVGRFPSKEEVFSSAFSLAVHRGFLLIAGASAIHKVHIADTTLGGVEVMPSPGKFAPPELSGCSGGLALVAWRGNSSQQVYQHLELIDVGSGHKTQLGEDVSTNPGPVLAFGHAHFARGGDILREDLAQSKVEKVGLVVKGRDTELKVWEDEMFLVGL